VRATLVSYGANCKVFTAAHRISNEPVAIKTIRKLPEKAEQQRQRVMREVGATRLLQVGGAFRAGGGMRGVGAVGREGGGMRAAVAAKELSLQAAVQRQRQPSSTQPQRKGHPHAVRLLDVYEDPKAYHLVMENLAGAWAVRLQCGVRWQRRGVDRSITPNAALLHRPHSARPMQV